MRISLQLSTANFLLLTCALLLLTACAGAPRTDDEAIAPANYAEHPAFPAFAARMQVEHGFAADELRELFATARRQQSILDAIARPAEAKPWHEYRPIFLTEARIAQGVDFWRTQRELLERAAAEYAVDPAVIAAIIGVETFYGRTTGRYSVLDALSTLGFDYPPRSAFFRGELEHFLLLTREEAVDPRETRGSYAGAMGAGQFIPSSYREYAVDFDGDGKRDLWNSWADAIGSVANYFRRHGWEHGGLIAVPAVLAENGAEPERTSALQKFRAGDLRTRGFVFSEGISDDTQALLVTLETETGTDYWLGLNNFYVITRYNRSPLYAMAVYELSTAIRRRYESAD